MSSVCVVLEGDLKRVAMVRVGVLESCGKIMLCCLVRKEVQDAELKSWEVASTGS